MKIIAIAAMGALGAFTACSSPEENSRLEKYRWEKRVILHDHAPEKVLELTAAERKKFQERDLVFLKANDELRERFDFAGEKASFILIGKDGEEKAKQSGSLNLAPWFDLIDTMPMRQREMSDSDESEEDRDERKFSRDE